MDKTVKERMKRYREKKRNVSVTENVTVSVTDKVKSVTADVTPYHPILYKLTDPKERKKLEAICEALSRRNLQSKLYYGCGKYSLPFDIVEDLLEATNLS